MALSNSEALQDRLVAVGVQNNVAAGLVDGWGGDNLEVAFCGTASPMGNGPRAQQCVAVFAGDKFFIVDAGARSAARANEIGLPMGRLSGVLLTHFHSDHISALGEMHLASWVRGRP
ncbi:MAG: MBL fold metallo-hydrolase, partial [Pseudomonadota bacterium]|nr:MBL fold metallo-hydrolase [Pseudomonadota bacterium]